MAKIGDDCYYFYFQSCIKGAACQFRHVEEAKSSSVTCDNWRLNRCLAQPCPFRHMELQQNTPCYYETQPGGCSRANCQFRHKFPKQCAAPPVLAAPATKLEIDVKPPLPASGQQVPNMWHRPPGHPAWTGPHVPPPPHMFPGPPMFGPVKPEGQGFQPYHPACPVAGNIPMMKMKIEPGIIDPMKIKIEPVIINPNEESDQDSIKGSPMKQPTRSVVSTTTSGPSAVKSNNPLDYFLNAKPWVDPNTRNVYNRSPSPRRTSPYCKQERVSPRRSVSPHRSQSPDIEGRRRSVSAERYSSGPRRRSNSLDRSRSPEWRDRRRFGRRPSRSPPRRRSRSPERRRGVGILNRFRPGTRGTKLEEVKVTGSKVISIKKEKKDNDYPDGEKEKQEEQVEEKVKVKVEPAPVVEEKVKSLEDIYRERALQSLMDAKRKKILENKRKRWEKVDSLKQSESDKSDKSDKQSGDEKKQSAVAENQSAVDEKGDNQDEDAESSDSADDDGNKSDLPDDIDIELGEGEPESEKEDSGKSEEDSDTEAKFESQESEEELPDKTDKRAKSSIVVPAKPSIKSRLGLKAVDRAPWQPVRDHVESKANKRSIKDRLGLKPSSDPEKPLRTGVIKLSKHSRAGDVMSRIRINREIKERKGENKNILMLPQITIKNKVDIEERKTGIKQRLGLLDDDENDSDNKRDRRKKRGIDEELMKLLREEEADIDEEDLELLSKKEKKKLLKKLLVQQGRGEEYEAMRRKKRRGFKKKKDRIDGEGDRGSQRRINIQGRLGRKEEGDTVEEDIDVENLPSEDEIELGEVPHETTETSPEKEKEEVGSSESEKEETREEIPVKSFEDLQKEKEEKVAKLRQAMEPKSLEDIRRERALKKASSGDESIRIAVGQNRRKIVIEEEQPPRPADPPVRVTFSGMEFAPKRKLIRLGKNQEQNENDQPIESVSVRAMRRERQIYVPPTAKRTEEPVVLPRKAGPPKGREIVDYGDMFPKKSTSGDIAVEKKIKLISSASESDLTIRPRLKLQKGPPKVEVKDATVKTFAEIMAEKKRKRLLAQQGKPYTPLVFSETESTSSTQGKKFGSMEDRLSPVPTELQVTPVQSSSVTTVSSPDKTQKLTKSLSTTNIQSENKPTRWKRRKVNNPDVPMSDESDLSQSQETSIANIRDTELSYKTEMKSTEKLEKVDESGFQKEKNLQKSSPSALKRGVSIEESKPPAEKKKKMSDSFMDLEDDILNMEDTDIDLGLEDEHQDADELMREIDELLS